MTIDEAIKHAEEVAEEHTRYNRYGGFESWNDVNCTECAKEHRQLANWLKELKQLREQEPCEDAVSRKTVLNTLNRMDSVLDEDRTVETYKELLIACYNDLPPVTPTHIETVTEFADRCRECGKTALTLAENDEILNEAWRLLMSVTEEDGVTAEQAKGMLKLMEFFFYKYHGLKKKPEWAENVEARIEREKADRTIRTISELLPRDKEEDQEHESEEEENK